MTDKVQKTREEIEIVVNRRLNLLNGDYFNLNEETDGLTNEIMNIINSLQEEPVSDVLDEAAKTYARGEYDRKNPSSLPWQCKGCYSPLIYAFKDGAQWQKEQMMAKAINTKASYTMSVPSICISLPLGIKVGDKVKVIVIKED